MRIKPGFELRNVCGEQVIIAEGLENINFSKLIHLNESAAYVWQAVGNTDFTAESVADLLCKEYDVDHATALTDAQTLLSDWMEHGLIAG